MVEIRAGEGNLFEAIDHRSSLPPVHTSVLASGPSGLCVYKAFVTVFVVERQTATPKGHIRHSSSRLDYTYNGRRIQHNGRTPLVKLDAGVSAVWCLSPRDVPIAQDSVASVCSLQCRGKFGI